MLCKRRVYNFELPSDHKALEFCPWSTGQVSFDPIIKNGVEQWFCMSQSRFGWVFCRLEEQCQGKEEEWKAVQSDGHLPMCTPYTHLWNQIPQWWPFIRVGAVCLSSFTHSSLQQNLEIHQCLSIFAKWKQGACTKLYFFLGNSLISKIWHLRDSGKHSTFRHILQTVYQKANYSTTFHSAISPPRLKYRDLGEGFVLSTPEKRSCETNKHGLVS